MPSVVGLLEQRELAARRRVDGLREEADRIQAELAAAEQEWQEWAIARRRVDAVLAPDGGSTLVEVVSGRRTGLPAPGDAVKPRSQVPVWREGLAWSVLSVDYQRILTALADRSRLHQGPLTCQEMAAAVRHGRGAGAGGGACGRRRSAWSRGAGWPSRQPGRFTLAAGVAGPGGGS